MKPDIQQAVTRAKTTLDRKNTFIVGDDWYGVRTLFDVADWRTRKNAFRSYNVFAEDDCGNEFLAARLWLV